MAQRKSTVPLFFWSRNALYGLCLGLAFGMFGSKAEAQETIKVGILHSVSGTMAVSEAPLVDVILMLIEQQNQRGGLLGRKLEPVISDPKSNWPLYEVKAKRLIEEDQVAVIFGCWTSASRKAVLPIVEESNGLLFYPVQYEGEEASGNVFYTGAAPNQQALPGIEYLTEQKGIERWVLLGTDYVYPRTTNGIIKTFLRNKSVTNDDIMVEYVPFGFSDWEDVTSHIKEFGSAGKKTAIISTINGDSNISFYRELARQNVDPKEIPVMAFSVGEEEMSGIDTKSLVGHLSVWNYFMSIGHPANREFVSNWHAYLGDNSRVTNDPMEAHYIGFNLWVKAVEAAGTLDVETVKQAILGKSVENLSGGKATMLNNHHITKPVYVGEIQEDGQFKLVWQSEELIAGDAWSDYLWLGASGIEADWSEPRKCGRYSAVSESCQDE